mgnify:CR=1 FL=1
MGNLLTCQYPGGRVITRQYDSLNRATNISESPDLIASYSYVGPGRVERRAYGNGTVSDYAYDAAQRMISTIRLQRRRQQRV